MRRRSILLGAAFVAAAPFVSGVAEALPQSVNPSGGDDTAAIQAAINRAEVWGSGTVEFSGGVFKTSAPLLIQSSNIKLRGRGGGLLSPATSVQSIAPALGGFVYILPSGTAPLSGVCMSGIYLQGTGNIGCGVYLSSHVWGEFELSGDEFATGLLVTSASSASSTQMNEFDLWGSNNLSTGSIAFLGGTPNANTSFNRFKRIRGNYNNNYAIQCGNTDSNEFDLIQLYMVPGGTGAGIIFGNGGGDPNQRARDNLIQFCDPGSGGVFSQAGAGSNQIVCYSRGNGAPLPTGPGSLSYHLSGNPLP